VGAAAEDALFGERPRFQIGAVELKNSDRTVAPVGMGSRLLAEPQINCRRPRDVRPILHAHRFTVTQAAGDEGPPSGRANRSSRRKRAWSNIGGSDPLNSVFAAQSRLAALDHVPGLCPAYLLTPESLL
jgi:hypothetical protein